MCWFDRSRRVVEPVRAPVRVVLLLGLAVALLALSWPRPEWSAEAQSLGTATAVATRPPSVGQPTTGPTAPASSGPVLPRGTRDRAAAAGPGAVFAWGYNGAGQLGDGTNLSTSTAVTVQGLSGATALAPGFNANHALAVRRDGSVVAWGLNDRGQLGDNTTTTRNVPLAVDGPLAGNAAAAAAVGYQHSLVLTAAGDVYAWGRNDEGQLGVGSTTSSLLPVRVKDGSGGGFLTGIVAVAAGGYHSLAVDGTGSVYAWGQNGAGALGDGSTTNRTLPVKVVGTGGVGFLNLGICSTAGANCQVAGGGWHSVALGADGRVFAWGANGSGQLGDETTTSRSVPGAVLPLSGTGQLVARSIATGYFHNLAATPDGGAVGWGEDAEGELGDGTTVAYRTRAVRVTLAATSAPVTGIASVAAGFNHGLALTTSGTVLAWGFGYAGQLGGGTTTPSWQTRATPVLNLSGVTAIAGGAAHSLALGPDFPLATVTPQPTATQVTFPTPLPTPTPYLYQPPAQSAGNFYLISALRVLDTRASAPGIVHTGFDATGNVISVAPLQPGQVYRYKVAGPTFSGVAIPAGVKGVQLNVTAVPTGGVGGFLTIFQGDIPDNARPLNSVLNPVNPINYNLWSTPLAPTGAMLGGQSVAGTLAAYNSSVPVDLIVDVTGYYQ